MASDSRDLRGSRSPEPTRLGGSDADTAAAAPATTAAEAVGRDPELLELDARHRRFVWPMTVFFLVYYMLLMALPGLAPGLMKAKVFGNFTFAYLFALSQFVMTFVVAWLYARFARTRFDPLAADLLDKLHGRRIREVAE
jgi:uncharacterized membrane protein (DUF485 family)